jgi:ribulose-phosphate 3-epimerase
MPEKIIDLLSKNGPHLSVGALSANIMRLDDDVALLERNNVKLLHFDIMDGLFVPQLTVGDCFVKAVRTSMLKDVHLMISEPFDRIPAYVSAGADIITIHAESCVHVHRCLQLIGEMKNVNDEQRGIARGIALNPSTPISALEPFIDEADIVFLIAVNPGFSGQKFIEATKRRFRTLREMLKRQDRRILTGIDGGVTRTTIASCAELEADIVVSGSAVFENRRIEENIDYLHKLQRIS